MRLKPPRLICASRLWGFAFGGRASRAIWRRVPRRHRGSQHTRKKRIVLRWKRRASNRDPLVSCRLPSTALLIQFFDRPMLVNPGRKSPRSSLLTKLPQPGDRSIELRISSYPPHRLVHLFHATELPDRHHSTPGPNRSRNSSASARSFNRTVSRFIR